MCAKCARGDEIDRTDVPARLQAGRALDPGEGRVARRFSLDAGARPADATAAPRIMLTSISASAKPKPRAEPVQLRADHLVGGFEPYRGDQPLDRAGRLGLGDLGLTASRRGHGSVPGRRRRPTRPSLFATRRNHRLRLGRRGVERLAVERSSVPHLGSASERPERGRVRVGGHDDHALDDPRRNDGPSISDTPECERRREHHCRPRKPWPCR